MQKLLKCNKGLTLVELIIGMAVLAIILTAVTATLFPMIRFQSSINELAEQNALLDDLANQIIYDLSMAIEEIDLTDLPLEPGSGTLSIPIHGAAGGKITYIITDEENEDFEAGIILRTQAGETNPLLPGEFHLRMNEAGMRVESIDIIASTQEGIIYTLTLTLSNEDVTFEREYAARPLALAN